MQLDLPAVLASVTQVRNSVPVVCGKVQPGNYMSSCVVQKWRVISSRIAIQPLERVRPETGMEMTYLGDTGTGVRDGGSLRPIANIEHCQSLLTGHAEVLM